MVGIKHYGFRKTAPSTAKNQLIPYTGNIHRGKFSWFCGFHTTTNVFLWIMALLISNISLWNPMCESFTVNSYFPLKMWKFSATDVFLYTVHTIRGVPIWEILVFTNTLSITDHRSDIDFTLICHAGIKH